MKKPMKIPKNYKAPRLGSASLRMTFNDKTGFTVKHAQNGYVLAHKPPEQCSDEWDRMWQLFADMGLEGIGTKDLVKK